jgi:hypothetical protein
MDSGDQRRWDVAGLSTRSRVVTLVVVVAVAAGLYFLWPPGSPGSPTASVAGSKAQNWYLENRPIWEAFDYVALDGAATVTECVRELVEKRYSGPEIDEEVFIRDVSAFLYALSAPGPDEYLERVAPYRRLRSDVYSDPFLHTWYRVVTGRPMPSDIEPRAALGRFWKSLPNAPGRPVAMSRTAVVQVAKTRPVPLRRDPDARLHGLTLPHYSCWEAEENEHWIGSFSEGFPRLTRPTVTFEEVMQRQGAALVATFHCAVRTSDGRIFTIGISLYFCPEENRWQVEGAANYYPDHVCWPY